VTGREAFRQAIVQRLIPSLRAFNPGLILLSSGFDAALGDVGNSRVRPSPSGYGTETCAGMDLLEEDFEWVTTEITKIADICCAGRVVSVLEGGYGQYKAKPQRSVATRARPDDSAVSSVMMRLREGESSSLIGIYHDRRMGDVFELSCPSFQSRINLIRLTVFRPSFFLLSLSRRTAR
jgi:hypothetical protein